MDNVRERLERIGELIESGDALERDLALEMLREVYSAIKFGTSTETREERHASEATGQEPEAVDATVLESENCQEAETEEPAAGPSEQAATEEPDEAPEPEPAAAEAGQPHVVARRVAPEVIRSLYGPEDEPEREPEPEPENRQQPTREPESRPAAEDAWPPAAAQEWVQSSGALKTEEGTRQRATLGDTMAAGHRTLGESLGNGRGDMASKIAAAERPGLKRSIGLNDRFLMIRDMFDGDAAAFDRAITRLDAFTDLDEAVVWIRENFDWSADSKGVALLVGLLERKLGH